MTSLANSYKHDFCFEIDLHYIIVCELISNPLSLEEIFFKPLYYSQRKNTIFDFDINRFDTIIEDVKNFDLDQCQKGSFITITYIDKYSCTNSEGSKSDTIKTTLSKKSKFSDSKVKERKKEKEEDRKFNTIIEATNEGENTQNNSFTNDNSSTSKETNKNTNVNANLNKTNNTKKERERARERELLSIIAHCENHPLPHFQSISIYTIE